MDGSMDGGGGGNGPPSIFEAQGNNSNSMQGIEQTLGNNANQILAGGQLQNNGQLQVMGGVTQYPMQMDLGGSVNSALDNQQAVAEIARRQSMVTDFGDTMMGMDDSPVGGTVDMDMSGGFMDTGFSWNQQQMNLANSMSQMVAVSQAAMVMAAPDSISVTETMSQTFPGVGVGGVVQSIGDMGIASPTDRRPEMRRASTSETTQGSMRPPPIPHTPLSTTSTETVTSSVNSNSTTRAPSAHSDTGPAPVLPATPSAASSSSLSTGTPTIDEEPPAHARKPASLENAYSQSGFNFMKLLHEIQNRPNPQIDIGAVDMSCSFVVTDNRLHDNPIVYVSPTFEVLTEYSKWEIRGQNCRFLQSPLGKVDAGSVRTFTDGETVRYFKRQLERGKEAQATLLNYRKGGMPFVNLLTMIPVSWEGQKNALFVGFQIDLVDHPEAIQKRNKNGSVDINYSYHPPPQAGLPPPGMMPVVAQQQPMQRRQLQYPMVDNVARILTSTKPTNSTQDKEIWDKMVLEQSDDLLHVLSLKGTILYCSPSVKQLLGYEPDALVGHSLSAYCHPSDIVPVTRDLKDTASGSTINIVYRMRQHADKGGYRWFESHGTLHTEQGKGKKCIILAGRPISVYRLPRSLMTLPHLTQPQHVSDTELWMKISISGIILYISSKCKQLLDIEPRDMIGQTIGQFTREDTGKEIYTVLRNMMDDARIECREVRHEMLHSRGHYQQVSTSFYNGGQADPGAMPTFLIAQTKFLKSPRKGSARANRDNSASSSSTPLVVDRRPSNQNTNYDYTSSQSPIRIAEQLGLPGTDDDDLFQQLKLTRSSSWQYELRQMEKTNKKLQEEVAQLLAQRKKRKRRRGAEQQMKECANCHATQTPEWRKGPSGKRDLCNGCGLRYAKMLTSEKSKTAASQASQGDKTEAPTASTTTTATTATTAPSTAVIPPPRTANTSTATTTTTAPCGTTVTTDKPKLQPISQASKVQQMVPEESPATLLEGTKSPPMMTVTEEPGGT